MEEWRRILAESIVKPQELADRLGVDPEEIEAVTVRIDLGNYPDGAVHDQSEGRCHLEAGGTQHRRD